MKTNGDMRPESSVDQSGLRQLLERVDARAKELQRALDTPRRGGSAARTERPTTGELLSRLRGIIAELSSIDRELAEASERWTQAAQQLWLEAEARLKDVCANRQWRIDGSWPSYLVAYGVPVRFDEKTHSVFVSDRKLGCADPNEIERLLADLTSALLPKDFAPSRFLEEMFKAYQVARGRNQQIPLLDVYRSYVMLKQQTGFWRDAKREKFLEVSINQFRACFTRMLEADAIRTTQGSELRLFPPINANDGVFLYNPIDRRLGFIGRIEFTGGEDRT